MSKLKTILLSVFIGTFLVTLPSFAVVDNFEVSPSSGLFKETNLAPGGSVSRSLTLKNSTAYLQTVRFKITNYKDGIVLVPFVATRPSLGNKVYIEIQDGATTLFAKDTISNFKSQEIILKLAANSSKVLTFNAYFDESADNDYQGSALSFDLSFEARWNGPDGEEGEGETIPGATPGTTMTAASGVAVGAVAGARVVGGAFLGSYSAFDTGTAGEEMTSPEETSVPTSKVAGAATEKKGFFDKLLANAGDILPPFCVDKISLIWLIIGMAIGYGGEYLLNTRIKNRNNGMMAGFMSFLWSDCCFWWIIIGIIVGYFIGDLLRRRKKEQEKKSSDII